MSFKIQKKYWQVAKKLTTAQLQKENSNQSFLIEEDFFNIDIGKRGHSFFLGYYSKAGIELALEKYDVKQILREKGFEKLVLNLDTNDPYRHRMTIYDKVQDPDKMLFELILKKERIQIDMPFKTDLNGKTFETIAIEWMCMQNPYKDFTPAKPILPGQRFPGLGMASKAVELLIIISWRLKLAGLVNIPQHFHNAFLYSKVFYYIDPLDQAKLIAMIRDTKNYPLEKVAWAMEYDAVTDLKTGQPAEWFISKQIIPLDSRLKKLFNSRAYRQLVKKEAENYKYKLDIQKYLDDEKNRSNK
ncbi:MAG: hypothetical protein AB7T22_13905 [Calditrichaceae bacterium]